MKFSKEKNYTIKRLKFIGKKCADLTGKIFNRLTVLERVENDKWGSSQWLCRCDCKNKTEVVILNSSLKSGKTQSCGCLKRETVIKLNKVNKKKYSTYDTTGYCGIGYTQKAEEFYFDIEDYGKIKDYSWHKNSEGYIIAKDLSDSKKVVQMHRLVMDCPDNMETDHIYHVNHDNRKSELRITTGSQNSMNKGLKSNNSSGVTGVYYSNREERWKAFIGIDRKEIHLGTFINFDKAVEVRKQAEIEYFGEYRYKNKDK